ncbi:multidrug resistance-associated ABC transporter [Pluteus cervinus]|uniref:Multidrug resistance-associated ABC transporter n=1 Tax=Pluteus cervinus TaxID=181527 RepID=A0ACD3ASW3_9AGAR|nr:multidrug resistance-associated ABC transporter [Pluteus cervinus]
MPRFEFEITVVLVLSAIGSLLAFFAGREKDGKIQLPLTNDTVGHEYDPFDVTTPEDILDGYPVDETTFWNKMRLRKVLISLLLSLTLVLETIQFGWVNMEDADWRDVATSTLRVSFAAYLLLITVRAVKSQSKHAETIIHLATLTTLSSVLLLISTMLPTTPPPVAKLSEEVIIGLQRLRLAVLALYIISASITSTTRRGPRLQYPPERIYFEKTVNAKTNPDPENVCGVVGASPWGVMLFTYTTKVVWLGNLAASLEIADLPIVPGNMRATYAFSSMRRVIREVKPKFWSWTPKPGSGWGLAYRLLYLNSGAFATQITLVSITAVLFYAPAVFLRLFIGYLEVDPLRKDTGWGWVYVMGLFVSSVFVYLLTGQLWSLSTTTIQVRLRTQLNSTLFAKTLVRKDVASSAPPPSTEADGADSVKSKEEKEKEEDDFSSKAQIMTLMTTDVDRVSDFAWHAFALVDAPIEIVIGSIFLYKLLGTSCFFGLAVTCIFLPINHWAGKVIVGAQENLMKARDERVALMNEVLGGIRMLKFMAWERSFEARILKVREKELKYQKLNYMIEVVFNVIWNGSPILVTLVSFWHFAVVRQEVLSPSIAFTALSIFGEMKFALNGLPETFINVLQCFVSLRRIEKYLNGTEVARVLPLHKQDSVIAFQSCTVTWAQDRSPSSAAPSAASTPRQKFVLIDLTLNFPPGELSLICGKLGSGKTLLLLALLGEADILTGQMVCPRSPPDALASYHNKSIPPEEWVVQGLCAYVPQSAWLRNASIKDNILFNLPYDEARYQRTLEVCALTSDLAILEDGDQSEIGERGVNLSGGQKARVSLARAVYSRASILFLDDVLSAVDAHTAHHLYNECLTGDMMRDRTIILVSHHVQLCAPGASYIVALDNGRVDYQGNREKFQSSGVMARLVQSVETAPAEKDEPEPVLDRVSAEKTDHHSDTSSTAASTSASEAKPEQKKPRKLIEEERRAVGRIGRDIWLTYVRACGDHWYWALFALALLVATLSPVADNAWIQHWTNAGVTGDAQDPMYYISIYAVITGVGLVLTTFRWFVLYTGAIHASHVIYKRLLEAVLFANIRFHDTVSRGRLLNRFGKDIEGIDSNLSDNFGRSIMYALSAVTTVITISVVGGWPFVLSTIGLGALYWNVAKIYGQTSRDMRRLDSVARSPLYSIYGETISGVTVLRAFGASTKFLRDMLRCVDTNSNPYYWMWGVNRWLSARFNLLSCAVLGATAVVSLMTPGINAALAGFCLAFASTLTNDLLFMVRRFVGLEQSMVALERVKEYSQLNREAPEFVEPRPPPSWPSTGAIECQDLVIRYAPELPDVLHHLNFTVNPGEKVGILGRTGSGKSTLALSFFRFVEVTEGRILVDGLDISKIGLTDLRSKLTIIPQDPTILSGSLRSTLDVFNEYQDVEIFEALRRVHLIPSEETPEEDADAVNANVFRDLDSSVSEGGENFSTGEKQLLCMARAILKRSKVLVMDEATASVDYATDELIGKTIRHEFAQSTILTIAHRLRTVIDYDRIMLLEQGRIVEFDRPGVLLSNPSSKFYALCKATGKDEFAMLKKLAGA